MATRFKYSGRDRYGELVHGDVEARNLTEAAEYLVKQKIVPLDISEYERELDVIEWLNSQTIFEERIGDEEMINFFYQLSLLSKAGVPISRGLRRLAGVIRNKRLSRVVLMIAEEVAGGSSLSSAFSHYPDIFSSMMVQLTLVGEDTGNLDESLLYLSRCIEVSHRNRGKMVGALRYPMFVVSSAVVAVMVMNVYVIPRFTSMFSHLRLELPWATRVIMASSSFMSSHKWLILLFIGSLIIGWRLLLRDEQIARRVDEFKLKIPYVGNLLRHIMVSQFAWSFKMMLGSGVTLVKSIRMSAGSVFNRYFSEQLLRMAEEIEHGDSFTSTMKRSGLFPPMSEQILEIGEETQRLEELCEVMARASDEEVDRALTTLAEVVEPILLVVVGGIVLVMVLGVYLPMWDMIKLVNR